MFIGQPDIQYVEIAKLCAFWQVVSQTREVTVSEQLQEVIFWEEFKKAPVRKKNAVYLNE